MSDTSGTPGTPGSQPERFADDQRRYRLDARIATGGMGEVWRGTDTVLGRPVAVKLLKTEYADDATFRSRFETEARHAAALHHPGVASVYDVGESRHVFDDGSGTPRPFLVMELVDGQPLSALLRGGRAMAPEVVRDLLAQAADAVAAAHRAGIVHRDLKPANLLVTPDRKVKITDFGIARATDGLGLTGTGQVMGTPQYLSPEQARGNPASPASDVYSLGVVAFECLTGHRPFDAESPVATALAHLNDPVPALPAVPPDLAAVVRRALSKRADERFADGAAFAAALRDPASAVAASTGARTEVVAPVPEVPPAERTQVIPSTAGFPAATAPPTGATTFDEMETRRSAVPIVLLLVAVLVVSAVIVAILVKGGGDDSTTGDPIVPSVSTDSSSASSSPPTSSPSASDTSPATFSIEEGDFVGRNVDDVIADLREKGLRPDAEERTNPGGQDADSVISVTPTTGLESGDTVRVTYWGEKPDTPTPTPTPTQTPTPTPTASPSGSATTAPSDSSSPAQDTSSPTDSTTTGGV